MFSTTTSKRSTAGHVPGHRRTEFCVGLVLRLEIPWTRTMIGNTTLNAAWAGRCRRILDNYAKAFELNAAMLENSWRLGCSLKSMDLQAGRPKENSPQGDHFTLGDLGINKNHSQRCQKLAEMSVAERPHYLTMDVALAITARWVNGRQNG